MELMQGKTAVVTGPTSRIGKEFARGPARLGASLILGCRDAEAGKALAKELNAALKAASIDVIAVDVSSKKSIEEFTRQALARYRRIDVLIDNAGVSQGSQPRATSLDGIELTFGTNVLCYFLVIRSLLQRLRDSAPARIVKVASTFASDLDLDDLQFQHRPFDSMKA